MSSRVFVSQWVPPSVIDEAGREIAFRVRAGDVPLESDALLREARGCQGLVCLLTDRVGADVIAGCPELRVISNCAAGVDNIDVEAATRAGIVVTNTPGVLTESTADLAFALLLGVARRLPEADDFMRAGRYRHWKLFPELFGQDVAGRTLGIYGFGAIGRAVARRAVHGFRMRVVYHGRRRLDPAEEQELDVAYADFGGLLREADVVSIHAPLTAATRHAFDAGAFAAMKPSAILVNTARGPIVDEGALYAALVNGEIWGAGLDVYEDEPRVHPELAQLRDRVVLLPHLGSATEETRLRMARLAVRNVSDALRGVTPAHVVNPEVLGHGRAG